MGKLIVVVGGQYGSEAKGHVTKRLVERELAYGRRPVVVRVGGPNAGHTIRDASGRAWALRQVPVGVVSRQAALVIGAGSEVDLTVLYREMDELAAADLLEPGRLVVDGQVTLLNVRHHEAEHDQDLQQRIGSTGKGVGAARADRLWRRAEILAQSGVVMDMLARKGANIVESTSNLLNAELFGGGTVIVEGTQGYGLGLHAGFYPQCTSGDCRAIDFLGQAGINPWGHEVEVWVVLRPHPIRVAGNSGYLYAETSWKDLGLEPEYTTVTKKERRVGLWDAVLARTAVRANGGHPTVRIAFTMVDQVVPELRDVSEDSKVSDEARERLYDWLSVVEDTGARVKLLTTGPDTGWWL